MPAPPWPSLPPWNRALAGLRRVALLAVALGLGCTGTIGGGGDAPAHEEIPADDPVRATPLFHFEPEDASLQPGFRRHTLSELDRTIREVTGVTADLSAMPRQRELFGLANDADYLQVVDTQHMLALFRMAHEVAVATAIDERLPCAAACTDDELRAYLQRAFAQPVEGELLAEYRTLYDRARAELSADNARRAVVQASLFSPHFLYRSEIGTGGRLTAFELAQKLSYFLWGAPPDDALLAKAFDGSIEDSAVYAAEVDRLLASPRAEGRVVELVFDWLGLDHVDLSSKDDAAELDPALEASMIAEATEMIRAVLFEGDGKLRTLMTTRTTFVDGLLAEHYGIDGVTGNELREVDLAGTGRAGLLTTALMLTAHSKESGRSPMQRGKFLVDELMCMGFPAEAGAAAMELPGGVEDRSFREQFAPLETTLPCSNCHRMLNAGFALDVFNSVGRRWPLDRVGHEEAEGVFDLAPYERLAFETTEEAVEGFAEHGALVRCFVAQTHRYAQGSVPATDDAELMGELEAAFDANDGHVMNLIRDIALSERFAEAVSR